MSIGTGPSIVGIGETYRGEFSTFGTDRTLSDADSSPTGVLVINGTDLGTTVTITNSGTGRYKVSRSLAGLTVGDYGYIRISATMDGIAQEGAMPAFRVLSSAAITGATIRVVQPLQS